LLRSKEKRRKEKRQRKQNNKYIHFFLQFFWLKKLNEFRTEYWFIGFLSSFTFFHFLRASLLKMPTIPTLYTIPLTHVPDISQMVCVGDFTIAKTPLLIRAFLSKENPSQVLLWYRGWIEHNEWYIQPDGLVTTSIADLLGCDAKKLIYTNVSLEWFMTIKGETQHRLEPLTTATKIPFEQIKWSMLLRRGNNTLHGQIVTPAFQHAIHTPESKPKPDAPGTRNTPSTPSTPIRPLPAFHHIMPIPVSP